MTNSIRKKGTKKLVLGFFASIIVTYFVYWLQLQGYTPNIFYLMALGAPFVFGFIGLLEVTMNRPFSEMEQWWDSLRGWQRGILGLTIVIIAFAVLIGAIATAGILGII